MVLFFTACDLGSGSDGTIVDDDAVSLLSSTEGDVVSSSIGMWDTKTSFTTVTDDDMGTVMEVYTDSTSEQTGTWGTVLAFGDIDDSVDFMSLYGTLTFKIKSDDFTSIVVKIPEVESEYTIDDGDSLGNGWYLITVSLIDYISSDSQSIAIFQYTDVATGSFYITDVEFSGDAIVTEDLPEEGGYIYSPDNTQSILYSDISPWDSGASIDDVVDADQGTSLEISGGTAWGDLQCISFLGIGKLQSGGTYYEVYDTLKFKIKAESATEVEVYAKGLKVTYDIADGESLGNDWYELTVSFSDFTGTVSDDGQIAFILSNTFYLTDVALY